MTDFEYGFTGPKRYGSAGEVLADLVRLSGRLPGLPGVLSGSSLSHGFRERLMLAVTGVNDCRYCRFLHSRLARLVGVSAEEVDLLLSGKLGPISPGERPALEYALNWARADGRWDPGARDGLVQVYGETLVRDLELVLGLIRLGNLSGNTWDWFLSRLSRGRFGRA